MLYSRRQRNEVLIVTKWLTIATAWEQQEIGQIGKKAGFETAL